MVKTHRVKAKKYTDGSIRYYPQERCFLLFWINYTNYHDVDIYFYNKEEALNFINRRQVVYEEVL